MEPQALEATERKVTTLAQTVNQGRITNQATYDQAVKLLETVKSMQAEPIITEVREAADAAHEAHTKALGVWHRLLDPLLAMEKALKGRILAWDQAKKREEEERARKVEEERQAKIRAEQLRLDREAREAAAKAAREAAERARKEGESKRAQEQARRDAEARALEATRQQNAEKIAAMEAAPPPEPKLSYERASTVQTKDKWVARFIGATDEERFASALKFVTWVAEDLPQRAYLLELEDLIESHSSLDGWAKAQKERTNIPGVRAVNEGTVAAVGRH